MSVRHADTETRCPRCGSTNFTRRRRTWWERLLHRGQKFYCYGCHRHFYARASVPGRSRPDDG